MKSTVFVVVWTIFIITFGIFVNTNLEDFCNKYTENITRIEKQINEENWNVANESMNNFSKMWFTEKNVWYKVLNHENFEDMSLYINILKEGIKEKDTSLCLEQIEYIKRKLDIIINSNKFDLDHIL